MLFKRYKRYLCLVFWFFTRYDSHFIGIGITVLYFLVINVQSCCISYRLIQIFNILTLLLSKNIVSDVLFLELVIHAMF